MSTLSINSVNNIFVRTAVAQQRVSSDRANVIESETQLAQDQAQLEKDLTYLATLQQKTHGIQKLEGANAQTNALERIEKKSDAAEESAQQASTLLSFITALTSANSMTGTNVDVFA